MVLQLGDQSYSFICTYHHAYVYRFNERFTYVQHVCLNDKKYGYLLQVRGDVLAEERPSHKYDYIRLTTLVYPNVIVEEPKIVQLNSILSEYRATKLLPKAWLDRPSSGRSGLVLRRSTF